MDIGRILRAFMRKLWLILLLTVIGTSIAAYISITGNMAIYESKATFYIMNKDKTALTGQSINYDDVMLGRALVQDYSVILKSRKVTSAVLDRLKNTGLTESTLGSIVSADYVKDSNVFEIKADYPDPKFATMVANTVSQVFVSAIRDLTNSDNIAILDEAQIPQDPLPVNNTKNIVLGFLAGFCFALALIYVMEMFDTTIRSINDIESSMKVHVMGIIPEHDIH
jgi:capsular polysaccharide biosynthesis protein